MFIIGLVFAGFGIFMCWHYPKMKKTLSEQINGKIVRYVEGSASVNRARSRVAKAWYPVVEY